MRILLDLVVQCQNVQGVEVLTLILVHTFDLYIKDGVRVDDLTGVLLDIGGKVLLVC